MDGGDLERLVATHAPNGGLRDEAELARLARGILEGLEHFGYGELLAQGAA